MLCELDGNAILRCKLSRVANNVLGPKDTTVTMAFLRGDERIVVNLKRQPHSNFHPETEARHAQDA